MDRERKLKLAELKKQKAKEEKDLKAEQSAVRKQEQEANQQREEQFLRETKGYIDHLIEGLKVILDDQISQSYDKLNGLYEKLEKNDQSTKQEANDIRKQIIDLTKVITGGLTVSNIKEAKAEVKTKEYKLELPKWLESNKDFVDIKNGLAMLIEKASNPPTVQVTPESQKAPDFLPFRRVVKDGRGLRFDDTPSGFISGGGSNGGGSSSAGLTDAELRATPVPTTESNRYAVDGDDELIVHQKSAPHAQADGLSNTRQVAAATDETALIINEAYPYLYNGSTWDRARGSATDGQLVNLGANNDVTVTSGNITETNSADIKTAVELIDDVVGTNDSASPSKSILVGGTDGTNIIAEKAPKISTLNSTSTPLGSNATWTGSWEDSLGYSALIVTGLVDQNSAVDGAKIQYATDSGGTNIVDTDENTIVLTGEAVTFILPFSARYFRISYTNGSVAQSAFIITSRLTPQTASSPILPLGAGIKLTDGGGLTRSVLAIQNNAGTGVANLAATASGNLPVSIAEATAEVPIKALTTLNVGQQSITGTASQITSAATGRNTVSIKALVANTAEIYIGTTSGVTASNGYELAAGDAVEFDLTEGQALYAISASGTQGLCKAEIS